ncbi:hypothetical protein BGZ81_008647 [Podila clonocystis]|nr:hypothetical protein BGZ81_008647 [Podila clonocystis]
MGYTGGSQDGVDLRLYALALRNRFDDIGKGDVMPTALGALLADPAKDGTACAQRVLRIGEYDIQLIGFLKAIFRKREAQ